MTSTSPGPGTLAPAIRAARTADVELTVRAVDGRLLVGREVTVAQRSHAFRFGCTGFEAIELANDEMVGVAREAIERLYDRWLELFNTATLPFYWRRFEPEPGRPDTARLLRAARWFTDRGVAVKGHPLCWHTLTAPWLLDLPVEEIASAQRDRITREVAGFAGLIDAWDVLNEVVIMPVFEKEANGITRLCQSLGRVETVRMMMDTARAANPRATLLLNDFDMSADYEHLIEDCLEAGIVIDALGLQSHMHQGYWGVEKTLDVLERFARFGLPIHFTETTLVSGELMPAEIVDLNDFQVADVAIDARWRSAPGRGGRAALHHVAVAPCGRGDHVVGAAGRRLAERPLGIGAGGWFAEARVRGAPRADQGRVVACADANGHRRRGARPVQRIPRRVRGDGGWRWIARRRRSIRPAWPALRWTWHSTRHLRCARAPVVTDRWHDASAWWRAKRRSTGIFRQVRGRRR